MEETLVSAEGANSDDGQADAAQQSAPESHGAVTLSPLETSSDMASSEPDEADESDERDIEDDGESPYGPIATVINEYLHRVRDVEDCARKFISVARKDYNAEANTLKEELSECTKVLDEDSDESNRRAAARALRSLFDRVDRHNNSSVSETLEKSLFVSLFAAYDKFVGDLILVLYRERPELYKNIQREVPLSEALEYESMETFRSAVLDKEIETLKRKSYIDQFADLESRFSLKTLRKFDEWPTFVECSQRRNLFVHCDGVVSPQYMEICKSVGFKLDDDIEPGCFLGIGAKYFFTASRTVLQVAVMLGQTLWRKLLPEDLEKADAHLGSVIFELLERESWSKAIALSKFALDLPKAHSDVDTRIKTVNYAIALKAIGEAKAAQNVMSRIDWSAAAYDFRLANSVLLEDYEEAKSWMEKIGPESELINEMAYHTWPLFREFREQDEFFEAYEKVYGYRYSAKLTSLAEGKSSEVETSDSISDHNAGSGEDAA